MARRLAIATISALACAVPAGAVPVVADRYDAFWLWAGVKPQPVLKHAHQIYLLQGEVVASNPARLVAQRPAIPRISEPEIWMVVRVQTLQWTPHIYEQLRAQITRWQAAGNHVVGVQIDFDAHTRHLADYAAFLADLRRKLPGGCKLGITGLLDWSANGDPKGLDALAGIVDEVVLQIYQGRHVIPGYADYFRRLDRLPIPFRVGLLQGGEWLPPPTLATNPRFNGYVVFLTNPVRP
jgi:hypothetical protein